MINDNLIKSINTLFEHYSNENLSNIVLDMQMQLKNKNVESITSVINKDHTSKEVLSAAFEVKEIMGQINVIVHALGIVNILPFILCKDEVIESVSLGADNATSEFDLITNKRIAEFKFITWRGNDAMRLKSTFADYFELAEFSTDKQKYLYLTDTSYFVKFLNGSRSFKSILSKNVKLSQQFNERYGNKYNYINEYYSDNKYKVNLVSLKAIAPSLFK